MITAVRIGAVLTLASVGATGSPSSLRAQASALPTSVSLGATAGYFTLDGEGQAFYTDVGYGVDGYLRFTLWRFALNGVVHYSRHDAYRENQAHYAVYVEPWYVVRLAPSRVALFLGPRVGWTRLSQPYPPDPQVGFTWDGVAFGGVTDCFSMGALLRYRATIRNLSPGMYQLLIRHGDVGFGTSWEVYYGVLYVP
jgi:hypothetical protein